MSGLAVAVLASVMPSAMGAVPELPRESITPEASLTITGLEPGVLRATDLLAINATITNPGPDLASGLVVSVSVTDEPIGDRGLLDPWEAGDLSLPSHEVARATTSVPSSLTDSGTTIVRLTAPPTILNFSEETFGVYGVTVSLEGVDGSLDAVHTFVTWLDTEPETFPVTILVLATGSPERVDTLLDTVDRSEAAFAVDPTVLSQDAPGLLADLDTFLLPAHNVDVASLARADGAGILDLALERARESSPSSLSSWLAVVPNLDQASFDLSADRGASAILSIPALSSASPEVTGYDGGVPPGVAVALGAEPTEPVLLLPDAGLSAALVKGIPGSVTAPARLTAETALLARDNTASNPILVIAGPSWLIEPDHRSGTLMALIDSPWVRLAPISTLLNHDPLPSASLVASLPSTMDIPVPLVTSAGTSLRGLAALSLATPDPVEFSDGLVDDLLRSLSSDRRTDPESRDAAIVDSIAAINDVRASVFLPGGSTLNLISASGNVPVTVTNSLDVEVTVRVILESRSPILRIEDDPELTIAPGTSQQVLVPVSAISSGNTTVRVSLTNLDGTRLTPVTEFSLRIRAQWGEVFTLAMAGFGLALLVAGTFRTIRRGRTDTRQGPSEEPDLDGMS